MDIISHGDLSYGYHKPRECHFPSFCIIKQIREGWLLSLLLDGGGDLAPGDFATPLEELQLLQQTLHGHALSLPGGALGAVTGEGGVLDTSLTRLIRRGEGENERG